MENINRIRILLISLFVLIFPFIIHELEFMGDYWIRLGCFCLIYAMLAMGLNIVVGFTGLLDLGYIGFYALGAYVYALMNSPQLHEAGVMSGMPAYPFWLTCMVVVLLSILLGLMIGFPTLRLKGDYLAIVTLGFGEIVRIMIVNLDKPINITSGSQGVIGIRSIHLFGWSLDYQWSMFGLAINRTMNCYFLYVLFFVLVFVISIRLQHSRVGRAWQAIRDDVLAADAIGIATIHWKLLAFVVGAVIAGVAGMLFANLQQFISPESFSLGESTMLLVMVVLGGTGSVVGVAVGALIINLIPEIIRVIFNGLQPLLLRWFAGVDEGIWERLLDIGIWRMLVFGGLLILMMRIRPSGLLGGRSS